MRDILKLITAAAVIAAAILPAAAQTPPPLPPATGPAPIFVTKAPLTAKIGVHPRIRLLYRRRRLGCRRFVQRIRQRV